MLPRRKVSYLKKITLSFYSCMFSNCQLQKFQFSRILSHSEMCLVVLSLGSYLKSIISFFIWYIVHSALKLTDIIEVISSDSSFTTFLLIILEFFENLPMIFFFFECYIWKCSKVVCLFKRTVCSESITSLEVRFKLTNDEP